MDTQLIAIYWPWLIEEQYNGLNGEITSGDVIHMTEDDRSKWEVVDSTLNTLCVVIFHRILAANFEISIYILRLFHG